MSLSILVDKVSDSNGVSTWTTSAKEVQELGSQNYVKRLLNHDNDARTIAGEIVTITWSIHTFMVYPFSFFLWSQLFYS